MQIDLRIVVTALRKAWGECQATQPAGSLRAALVNYSTNSFKLIQAGQVKSTAANNQHTSFETGEGALTPQQVVGMWAYLVEIFDTSAAELAGQPTDAQVEAQMETHLRPVTGATNNWMYLMK